MVAAMMDLALSVSASDLVVLLSVVQPFGAKENVTWIFVLCCCCHLRFPRCISRLGEKNGYITASGAVLGCRPCKQLHLRRRYMYLEQHGSYFVL